MIPSDLRRLLKLSHIFQSPKGLHRRKLKPATLPNCIYFDKLTLFTLQGGLGCHREATIK